MQAIKQFNSACCPSIIGSPGGYFGFTVTSCFSTKEKPSLQGRASFGGKAQGHIASPKDRDQDMPRRLSAV
jgi:hypothetical protein